jgi:predicted unusual protein kinase regulating ubiquinone biosynthesis (AarF/ABC1/UbiB family)
VLEALTVLSELKLIHCDLKPENILINKCLPTVKVIDMGMFFLWWEYFIIVCCLMFVQGVVVKKRRTAIFIFSLDIIGRQKYCLGKRM